MVTRFGPFVLWSPPFALSPEIVRSGSISTTFVGCSSEEEEEKSSCVDEEAGTVEGIPLRCRRSVDGRDVRGFEKKMICQRPSFRSCGKHPTDEPSGRELCMQVLWPCVRFERGPEVSSNDPNCTRSLARATSESGREDVLCVAKLRVASFPVWTLRKRGAT